MKTKELRILLTQNCNFKCFFCHREGVANYKKNILSPDDYYFIVNACKRAFEWDTVSLTGGEPMLHRQINEIVNKISDDSRVVLITNGSILSSNTEICNKLDRITISLHTLNNEKYMEINQVKYSLDQLLYNIALIRNKFPKLQIRFNVTLIRGFNTSDMDLLGLINYAENIGASIKFIENMTENINEIYDVDLIQNILIEKGYTLISDTFLQKEYKKKNNTVVLSKIVCSLVKETKKHDYCNETASTFLLSDGTIKPCMNSETYINILEEVKNKDEEALLEKIESSNKQLKKICIYK